MYKKVTVAAVLETKENDDKQHVLNGSKRFYSQQETRLIRLGSYFGVSNVKVV